MEVLGAALVLAGLSFLVWAGFQAGTVYGLAAAGLVLVYLGMAIGGASHNERGEK